MMRVAFIAPTNPGENAFYAVAGDFMRAAALQLDVELEVIRGHLRSQRGWRKVDFTRYSARHGRHATQEALSLRALATSYR